MKIAPFQRFLREKGLDAAFLVHPDLNLEYFTQMKFSHANLFITPSQVLLYLTKLDALPRLKGITAQLFAPHWEKKLQSHHIRQLGVNKMTLTLAQAEKIKALWPKAKLVDISLTLIKLRIQKTKEELKNIAQACAITTKALEALLPELRQKKLKTEREAAFFLEKSIRRQNAELAFPSIVATGKNTAVPHHIPTSEKLKRGFLVLDFGAKYRNYCADLTRTLFLGNPTKKEKEVYGVVLRAQEQAIKTVKEGISFKDLDGIARKKLGKYSKNFIHSLGHGIGLEVHEAPLFSDKKEVVRKNCPFTIEPGIYIPGKFGIRIEDTLVFDGKVKILTTFTKDLIIIN